MYQIKRTEFANLLFFYNNFHFLYLSAERVLMISISPSEKKMDRFKVMFPAQQVKNKAPTDKDPKYD
jgi:hypothetical protein